MKNFSKTVDLRKAIPVQQVQDGFYINGNGEIAFGFAILLPEVYTFTVDQYDALQTSIIKILNRLPIGTRFHCQNFIYTDKYEAPYKEDNFARKHNLKSYDARSILKNYCNIYFTFSSKRFKKKKDPLTSSYLTLPDFIFKQPIKNVNKLIAGISREATNIQHELDSIAGIKVKRKSSEELISALYDYFNLSYTNPSTSIENLHNNPISFINNTLKVGMDYVEILSMIQEGKDVDIVRKNKPGASSKYADDIGYSRTINCISSTCFPITLGLPFNHVVNTTIEIIDKHTIEPSIFTNAALQVLSTFGSRDAENKYKETERYLNIINEQNAVPCFVSINIIIHDPDLDRLKNKIGLAQSGLANMNEALGLVENFDLANAFFDSCPGNLGVTRRTSITTVENAVCYIPKETCYYSDPQGITFVDRLGAPVVLDMWNSKHTVNRNKLIFGPSGSGKSVGLNHLSAETLSTGNVTIILDIGGSYKRNTIINRGVYIDSSDKKNLSFNIFYCPQDKDGKYLYKTSDEDGEGEDDLINFIYTIIRRIWKGKNSIRNEEKAILKESIGAYFEHVNANQLYPKLDGYFAFISIFEKEMNPTYASYIDFSSLRLMLQTFVSGEYRYLLNADTNRSLRDAQLIVIDMEAIQKIEDMRDIVSIINIKLITDIVDKLPRRIRKSFTVDEGLDFLTGDIADLLGAMFRKFRKRNGEVNLATQNVNFLKSATNEVRDSILGNCDTKILLDHSNYRSLYPDLQKWLSLTDEDIELLDTIEKGENYREIFIKMGNLSRVFRLEISKETQAVYTSSPEEVEKIEKYFARHGNMALAIDEFVKQKYEKQTA